MSVQYPPLDRRGVIAGLTALLVVRPAAATPISMLDAIRAFTGGVEPQPGRLRLDIPALVENGNAAPLTVTAESPMTPDNFVKAIGVFNQKNPQPDVAIFRFSSRSGRATVSTRIRLSDSQTIVAVAACSDGSFWSGSADLVVTLPACAEP